MVSLSLLSHGYNQQTSGQYMTCVDAESFVRSGPILTSFLVDEGKKEDPNNTKSGPLSDRQRNATFKWRFAGRPMLAQH